jgi:hypothetical protein
MRPRPSLALALCALACGAESQTEPQHPSFQARRELSLGIKPEALIAADLDGDGRRDLVCATRAPGRLLVWWGSERGWSREPREIPCGQWPLRPVALAPGTFGAGAKQRFVALATRADSALSVYDLRKGERVQHIELEQVPRALAAGSWDGAREHIAWVDDRHVRFIADGEAFEAGPVLEHTGSIPRCASFASDGRLAIGFQGTSSVSFFHAGKPVESIDLSGFPRDLLWFDGDADGALELAVVGGDRSLWIRGGGKTREHVVDTIPIALRSEDLDGDGQSELIVLHDYGLSAVVLSGFSPDREPDVRSHAYAGQTPVDLALVDADGDGRLDVTVANRDGLSVSWLRGGEGGALLTGVDVPVGKNPGSIAAGDLFGDSNPELCVINAKQDSVSVIAHTENGVAARAPVPVGVEPRAVTIADLDGDGRNDVSLLVQGGQGVRIERLACDERGVLAPMPHLPSLELPGMGGVDLLVLDSWAVIADPGGGRLLMLPADARSASQVRTFEAPSAPRALAAIQMDADPELELAVVLGAPGPRMGVAIFDRRKGDLVPVVFLPTAGEPLDVAVGDLNADGKQDLVLLSLDAPHSIEGHVTALVCTGALEFEASQPLSTGYNPRRIACRDVDGDGRADFFVSAQNSHVVNAWLSGVRGFESLDDLGAGRGCLDLVAADLDGDGKPDLAVANAFSDDVSLIYNR